MTQGHLDLRDAPRDRRGILLPDASEFGQAMDETIQQVMQTLAPAPAAPAPAAAPDAAPNTTPLDRAFAALHIGTAPASRLLAIAVIMLAGAAVLSLLPQLLGRTAPAATTPASSAPTMAPTALPPTRAPEPIAVFWAPSGEAAGTFDRTQPYTPTARFGQDWLAIEVPGGGHLWVLRGVAHVDEATFGALPDLQPPPTPTAAPYVPPRPTDPPQPPCKTAGVGDKTVTVCGWGDLDAEAQQQWAATYGGNIGGAQVRPTLGPSN